MRPNYQSDLDDDELRDQPGIWRVIALTLISLLISVIVAVARAEDQSGEAPCIPTVSDYDTYLVDNAQSFVVIWWCEESRGLRAYWWTDSGPNRAAAVLRLAGRDPDEFRQQLSRRWSTVDQLELAMRLQYEQAPRCFAAGMQVSCISWQLVDGRRMCEVSGMIRADGSRLGEDSWAACVLRKAPVEGWR